MNQVALLKFFFHASSPLTAFSEVHKFVWQISASVRHTDRFIHSWNQVNLRLPGKGPFYIFYQRIDTARIKRRLICLYQFPMSLIPTMKYQVKKLVLSSTSGICSHSIIISHAKQIFVYTKFWLCIQMIVLLKV